MSDLPAQIMNLPCKSTHVSYKRGHRDARHAAAELAGVEIDRLEQHRNELLAALDWIANVNAMDYEYRRVARAAITKVESVA